MRGEKLGFTPAEFQSEIMELVSLDHSHLEALAVYQERHNLDEYAISHLLIKSKAIMANLKAECSDLHLIKGKGQFKLTI